MKCDKCGAEVVGARSAVTGRKMRLERIAGPYTVSDGAAYSAQHGDHAEHVCKVFRCCHWCGCDVDTWRTDDGGECCCVGCWNHPTKIKR